jgi:putative tricarboxylic transport membrane protein
MFERLTGRFRTSEARTDVALAGGLMLFSGLLYYEAERLPPPFFDPLGSAAVPKLTALVLTVLAALLVLGRLLRAGQAAGPGTAGHERRGAPLVALGAVLIPIAYVALMQVRLLGFREATVLFVFALGALLGRRRRWGLVALAGLALLIGIGFDYLFTQVFYIDLPRAGWF